jgi:hypothetical protein
MLRKIRVIALIHKKNPASRLAPSCANHQRRSARRSRAASQALAQERSQGGSVDVTGLSCDGVHVEAAAVRERLRAFDPQVLEVGQR